LRYTAKSLAPAGQNHLPCCRWSSIKFKNRSETGISLITASRTKASSLLPLVFYKIQKPL